MRLPAVQRSPLSENTPNSVESMAASRIGVGEHHGGALAAELHREPLQERRGVAEDELAGAALAGERDERHVRVLHERVAGLLAESVDEVEDARRDARPPRRCRPTATPTAA
jgi:hypothetical protein